MTTNFRHHLDGQTAGMSCACGRRENYLWEGLALIRRDGTSYLNEPAITGGNPVMAGDKVLFNDLLGSTLGAKSAAGYAPSKMTAFGESADTSVFFTGKPQVDGLGYAFLFRNYRPDQGKWQTADPLGYPDGWNNFAYVNNDVICAVDRFGTDIYHVMASGSVGGAGHSAAIVGNSMFGYRIINHGATNTDPAIIHSWENKYPTVAAALAALQNGRSGDEVFDSIQKWETTPAQDDIAYGKMLEGAAQPYSWNLNNCWQVIREGVLEAFYPNGALYCSLEWIPSLAYLDNYLNPFGPASLDINQVIQGLAE